MPCSDGRRDAGKEELQRRLGLATRLLCEVISSRVVADPSDELKAWWKEHSYLDRSRSRP